MLGGCRVSLFCTGMPEHGSPVVLLSRIELIEVFNDASRRFQVHLSSSNGTFLSLPSTFAETFSSVVSQCVAH